MERAEPRAGARAATGLGLLLLAATALRLPAAWESGNALNHVSGAWMALADDLAHGTLYRALLDPGLGFGGTRFFPLAFAAHAALLRLGVPLLPAGFLLSAAAGALLVGALTALLRRAGLGRAPALAAAALALGGFAGQHALAAVRGDLLAVALQVAGLASLLAQGTGRIRTGRAAAWLALATLAKPTALTAAAAGVAFLWRRAGGRAALRLALWTAALTCAGVLVTEAASRGRFLSVVAACAGGAPLNLPAGGPTLSPSTSGLALSPSTGGLALSLSKGGSLRAALAAPLRMARLFAVEDRAGLVLVAAGTLALAIAWRRAERTPPAVALAGLWLPAAALGALVVLASRGTGVNHLLELEAAAATALGAAAAAAATAGRAAAIRLAASTAAAAGFALAALIWRADAGPGRLAQIRAIVAAVEGTGAAPGPILSEDPLVPLLAGERPAVVDPWMLRAASERDFRVEEALETALASGRVRAVVVLHAVDGPGAESWFVGDLGLPALSILRRSYRLAAQAGLYHVYRPAAPAADLGAVGADETGATRDAAAAGSR